MRYRRLGKTGLSVSEIGIGTWGMGGMWGPRDDATSLESLRTALDLGLNFIDTAYAYGNGHSETLIGQVLRDTGAAAAVATKIPPKNHAWPAKPDISIREVFPKEWIIDITEQSLKNLGRDSIDLQQLHVWSPHWLAEPAWAETLEAIATLKQAGKIRFFGVSLNDHAPDSGLSIVESGLIDTVQVIYNIFDQSPEESLLPLCKEHDIGVIARVPFDEGSLTGTLTPTTTFPKSDWRRMYFQGNRLKDTCKRVDAIAHDLATPSRTLPQLALQFCLSHEAVSTVIPGMRKPEHIRTNAAVATLPPLSSDELAQLRKHRWVRNFYPSYG